VSLGEIDTWPSWVAIPIAIIIGLILLAIPLGMLAIVIHFAFKYW
jgi:hypothetical protein